MIQPMKVKSYILALCLTAPLAATAAVSTFNAIDDTTLLATGANVTFNYGGRGNVIIGWATADRWGLMRWDLSALSGTFSTINSIRLQFDSDGAANAINGTMTYQVQRMLANNGQWVEGTANGVLQAGSASWANEVQGTSQWVNNANANVANIATAGNDGVYGTFSFVGSVATPLAIAANTANIVDLALSAPGGFDSLTQLVTEWAAAGAASEGFLIKKTADTATGNRQVFIRSNESAAFAGLSSARLVIDYTPVPEPSTTALLGVLGALGLFLRRRR